MARELMATILADALWTLGVVGLGLALAAGLLLTFAPGQALRVGKYLNREWSVGWLARALDTPRKAEPFFYRHHRWVGGLLLLATGWFFWTFATVWETAALAAIYEGTLPTVLLNILAQTLTVILVLGNGLGFAMGVLMLVRPSALKGAEAAANTWVDTDRAAELLNRRDDRPESLTHRHPRRVGVVILLAALYILAIGAFLLR